MEPHAEAWLTFAQAAQVIDCLSVDEDCRGRNQAHPVREHNRLVDLLGHAEVICIHDQFAFHSGLTTFAFSIRHSKTWT